MAHHRDGDPERRSDKLKVGFKAAQLLTPFLLLLPYPLVQLCYIVQVSSFLYDPACDRLPLRLPFQVCVQPISPA